MLQCSGGGEQLWSGLGNARLRLVLDKLTDEKLRNSDPLRMVTASSIVYVQQKDDVWSYANIIKDRKTTLSQNIEKLSVNFNVNKVVASSEHESSIKPDSGVWFIRWRYIVLVKVSVVLSLEHW